MIEVATAASSVDLITSEMVDDDTVDPTTMALCISAASRLIALWCKREFVQQSYKERIEAPERIRAVLYERPVIAVSSITCDGESIADYLIDQSPGIVCRTDGIPFSGPARFGGPLGASALTYDREPSLVVEYTAGYLTQANSGDEITESVTLPKEIELSAIALTRTMILEEAGKSSEKVMSTGSGRFKTTYVNEDALTSMSAGYWAQFVGEPDFTMIPLNVRRLLLPHRRQMMA